VGTITTGIIAVFGAGITATIVAMLVHGRIRNDTLTDFRDHSGLVSGVSGTLFAVTVGMLVVASWGAIGTAKDNASAEARALDDLVWYAHTMHQPYQNRVTALLQDYTQQVVTLDWPEMAQREELSQQAWQTLDAIRYEFSVYTPKTAGEIPRYQQALSELQSVYDDRLTRQDETRSSVPSILWFALIVSGSIVILVPVFFGSTRRPVHGMLAFLTAAVLAFVLFMIAEFTHPFSGAIRVNPEAFVATEDNIRQIDTLWATANIQQARAVFKPAPIPSNVISLLASAAPKRDTRHRRKPEEVTVHPVVEPGAPAPGGSASAVAPAPAPAASSGIASPPPPEPTTAEASPPPAQTQAPEPEPSTAP
jgi:hypothetical protein